MTRIIWILIILVFTGCAGTFEREMLGMMGATSYQNEPDGFRGIKWGQNIEGTQGLRLVKNGGDSYSIYAHDDDQLLLGDATLKTVEYLFWDNRFLGARMIAGAGKLQALKNVLTEKFGDGHQLNQYMQDYSWFGPIAFVKLLRLSYMSDCVVTITSREINDQMNIHLAQKAKTGAVKGARQDF